ncbi:ATP-binding protein [Streptomyces canus]|uniref:ATP-binding protein n=1 Tax=Streptomyces canus TaxID=58343 RepID=UPI00384B4C01
MAGAARGLRRRGPAGAVPTARPVADGRRGRGGDVGSGGPGSLGGERARLHRHGRLQPDGRSADPRLRRRRRHAPAERQRRRPSVGHAVRDADEHARFYRADPARSRLHGGSGLGLAIAATIAEGHGGRLELDTAPGRGCTFRLVLPAAGSGRESR